MYSKAADTALNDLTYPCSKKAARVIIVDDHPLIRRGFVQLINAEQDLEVVGEAAGAAEALNVIEKEKPDLVMVDISLKDGSGIELIKQIKIRNKHVKMLVSSMHDELLFAERVIRAGALGYIQKEEATEQVIKAIRQVLRGKMYLSERMSDRMLHSVVSGDGTSEQSPIESLSNRELEVFELIGEGLTTRKIAQRLHLSVKTIETHRDNIKRKLSLDTNVELIRRAVQWNLEQGGGQPHLADPIEVVEVAAVESEPEPETVEATE